MRLQVGDGETWDNGRHLFLGAHEHDAALRQQAHVVKQVENLGRRLQQRHEHRGLRVVTTSM